MNKHPALYYLKYLLVRNPQTTDGELQKALEDWGFLSADPTCLQFIRAELPAPPQGFDPMNRSHRPSVRYLRDEQIYEMFHPNESMTIALELLDDPQKRMATEQILLARLDPTIAAKRVNQKHNWHITGESLQMYGHYFWDVPSMTFDEWGRYMYNRTAMYDQYMGLLMASPKLAFYHLRLDQTIESKNMIKRAQEIAYFTLEEIAQKPGTGVDKVKSIGILGKIVIEAHNALSTSDMALKDVLKQFEHWRMEHPQVMPPSIRQLAPAGNYSNSGLDPAKNEKTP
jgi:hypothetical protein